MTRRTDHTARAGAGRTARLPGTGRQVALATSVALVAVTGTATIAWSALSLALGSGVTATAKTTTPAAPQTQETDSRRFTAATRALAATPVAAMQSPAPVTLGRDAQRLSNAVQLKLFGGVAGAGVTPTAPVTDATAPARTIDPVNRSVRPVERPVAAPTELAESSPVAAPASAPQVRVISVPQSRVTATQDKSRMNRMWSVGVFR
mgnify:CR=1 FL=1